MVPSVSVASSSLFSRNIMSSSWLDNKDIRPTPVADRTWGPWTCYLFWFSAAANLSNWYSPTSFMTQGLTMWEALLCHLGGQILAGITMVISGRPGAIYHVGYPILARASFGWLGSVWPIIQRVVMSIIWNGINVVQGGQCVYVMLHAIFPSIANLKNGMAKDDALNTGGMIGMLIFWLVLVVCIVAIPIPKLKYYLVTKVPVFVISAIAMLVWTLTLSKGLPHEVSSSRNGVVFTPSSKKWILIRFILISWANNSTFIVTAADLQRYTIRANDNIFGQIFGFPVSNFIVGLVGVIVGATSSKVIRNHPAQTPTSVPKIVWNPIVYLDKIQTQDYTPANRAGAFLLAFCFAYCGLFSCIVENLLPAGNDLSALWPRHFTVRRCILISAVLTYACVPWKLLGTSTSFISWLASYQIFLSAVAGVLLSHYYLVSGGLLLVEPDCYSTSKRAVYRYTYGVNIRAYIAYLIGVAPNFYGFLGQLGLKITKDGVKYYYFAFPVGVFASFMSYLIINIYFPPKFTTIEFFPKQEKGGGMEAGNLESMDAEGLKEYDNHYTTSPGYQKHELGMNVGAPIHNTSMAETERVYNSFIRHNDSSYKSREKIMFGLIPRFKFNWKEPYQYVSPDDPRLEEVSRTTHESNIPAGLYYDKELVRKVIPHVSLVSVCCRKRHFNRDNTLTNTTGNF